jgi:hypothetical protein
MGGIELTEATLHDYKDIAALQTESWRSAYRGILPGSYLDGPILKERDPLAKPNVFRWREASRRFPCEGLRYFSRFCLRSAGRRAGLGCPPGQYPCEARLQRQGDGSVIVQIGR